MHSVLPKRSQRINQLIKEELGQIILREVDCPPDVLLTITRVETSVDLAEAKVFISVLPREKLPEIFRTVNRSIYELQGLLNRRLRTRPIPRIKFQEETETASAGRIEEILEELKKKKK